MTATRFTKVLVANRGEIACRVLRAARDRGYRTVAAASDADLDAPHVRIADETVRLGPAPVAESYLSIEAVVRAARRSGADAIHPGYGFLSENADFAFACVEAGIVFVGPPPDAVRLMANKGEAKRRMIEAGVPCLPGYQGEEQAPARLAEEAARIGFPVMVKAAAGGGGRGMRLVRSAPELADAIERARSEALGAFGSGELILEKALLRPRHVEIQVFADAHGAAIHLGERDCSVQRRNQKVIEEAPCPALTPGTREAMGEAAVRAALAIGYRGAGTVEFLLDEDGRYYFLEMNTRLQVEHPVTEMATGLDLVGMQFDVAAGKPLALVQSEVRLRGHAVEARLYAEDPASGFLPSTGRIVRWAPPSGEGVRVDDGVESGSVVSPYYDPMLAKVIAWGRDRDEARRRLIRALEEATLFGPRTNRDFLLRILRDEVFALGEATTAFIADRFGDDLAEPPAPPLARALAAALFMETEPRAFADELRNWRSTGPCRAPLALALDGGPARRFELECAGGEYRVAGEGVAPEDRIELRVVSISPDDPLRPREVRYEFDGLRRRARFAREGDEVHLDIDGRAFAFADATRVPAEESRAGADGVVRAPMAGKIVAVAVEPGQDVRRDDPLVVLEAMKMQNHVVAPADGTVETVAVAAGDQVDNRQVLVVLKPDAAAPPAAGESDDAS